VPTIKPRNAAAGDPAATASHRHDGSTCPAVHGSKSLGAVVKRGSDDENGREADLAGARRDADGSAFCNSGVRSPRRDREQPTHEVVEAIRAVAAGDAVLAPGITRQLLDQVGRRLPSAVSRAPARLAQLTDRELQVLGMLAAGMSNAEISEALVLSEATVKTHVSRVLAKLGLRDRVQAVIYAYESGLIAPHA
jgi:DNA-binding CsgD family transcriptional regulator